MSEQPVHEVEPRVSRSLLVRLVVVVVAFLAAGAGAGVLWERLWHAPAGVTYKGHWYIEPAGPDVSFQGIALFVLIAFPLGILLGVLVGLWRGHETAVALTVLVAASVAGFVMYAVGSSLGPADPQALAAGAADYTTDITGGLGLTAPDHDRVPWHSTALLVLPTGAMAGLVVTYLLSGKGLARRPRG
ncbi:putative membrane protein [Nocardioides sp. BE266]|uniref:hypothetical protein n=1 Tax=Nocardioides sp. BE266 TaxID=2817725 RepID=UPI0028656F89|nr:hypothetical protein [Nocardioides sp. BE266]MDR7253883.1 putative membrane protein [Nocardioides sp. BE266]